MAAHSYASFRWRPLCFSRAFFFFRTPPSDAIMQNSTELCNIFGSEPIVKMDLKNSGFSSPKMRGPKTVYFGQFYDDVAS